MRRRRDFQFPSTPYASTHVTQRPGSSCLATSVNTLTTGSQATAAVPLPDFTIEGADEPLRAISAAGTRTSTEVSERPWSRSEIVRVRAAGVASRASRSALAARLIVLTIGPVLVCGLPVRSSPDAN